MRSPKCAQRGTQNIYKVQQQSGGGAEHTTDPLATSTQRYLACLRYQPMSTPTRHPRSRNLLSRSPHFPLSAIRFETAPLPSTPSTVRGEVLPSSLLLPRSSPQNVHMSFAHHTGPPRHHGTTTPQSVSSPMVGFVSSRAQVPLPSGTVSSSSNQPSKPPTRQQRLGTPLPLHHLLNPIPEYQPPPSQTPAATTTLPSSTASARLNDPLPLFQGTVTSWIPPPPEPLKSLRRASNTVPTVSQLMPLLRDRHSCPL